MRNITIILQWDPKNTALFTEKLYRHVRRKELEFSGNSKGDDLKTIFEVGVSSEGDAGRVISELMQHLNGRVVREESRGIVLKSPEIYRNGVRWDPEADTMKLTAWYGPKKKNKKLVEF